MVTVEGIEVGIEKAPKKIAMVEEPQGNKKPMVEEPQASGQPLPRFANVINAYGYRADAGDIAPGLDNRDYD
jgi:hypothetical protein